MAKCGVFQLDSLVSFHYGIKRRPSPHPAKLPCACGTGGFVRAERAPRVYLGHRQAGRFQKRPAGETIPYQAGDLAQVRILAVAGGDGSISSAAAEKRRADVHKAEAQSEITNQMIFSTASGSKWGDYDVDVDK
jgi:hypothetical protein